MHQLGHNLGLDHGGHTQVDRAPNYFSVMNSNYQLVGLRFEGVSGVLDYSRLEIAAVEEDALNEPTAFEAINGTTEEELSQYRVRAYNTEQMQTIWLNGNASFFLDFNDDGNFQEGLLPPTDLNGDGMTNSSFEASQNDWDNLIYRSNQSMPSNEL